MRSNKSCFDRRNIRDEEVVVVPNTIVLYWGTKEEIGYLKISKGVGWVGVGDGLVPM